MTENLEKKKKENKVAEGTDSENNNSDIWFHTNFTGMMEDDDKSTKHLVKFLNKIGYELPDVEIID
jgi:hypothetical protein